MGMGGDPVDRFVCLFVCLFNRSLRAETHLGPDGTRLEQMLKPDYKSLYKHAGRVVYENNERGTDLKLRDEGKEDHGHSQQIKFNNFTVSPWAREGRSFIQSQLPWRLFSATILTSTGTNNLPLVTAVWQISTCILNHHIIMNKPVRSRSISGNAPFFARQHIFCFTMFAQTMFFRLSVIGVFSGGIIFVNYMYWCCLLRFL